MYIVTNNELYHYGVEGMHWGIRRYQNPDGTLTEKGKRRFYKKDGSLNNRGIFYKYRQKTRYEDRIADRIGGGRVGKYIIAKKIANGADKKEIFKTRAAVYTAKYASVKIGKQIFKKVLPKVAGVLIAKIASDYLTKTRAGLITQNHYYDPIDVDYKEID